MPNLKARPPARDRALQFLFGLDFTGYHWEDEIESYWEANPAKPSVKQYAQLLIRGVALHQEEIDTRIRQALEHWSLERIGFVERTVLRLAAYEMIYRDDVPPSVAINEGVELARRFGAEEAPRFVNGVLDRMRGQMEGEGNPSG